jgi:hypothetical protein
LDGLLKDLKDLSTQVDSHEEVLETETSNLKIAELSVKAVETTHKEAMDACEKEKQDAMDRVSQFESELAELMQIAKPSVRFEHVTKVTITNESLIQQGAWSKDSCLAFLSYQKKHHLHHGKASGKNIVLSETNQKFAVKQEPEDNNNNNNNEDDDEGKPKLVDEKVEIKESCDTEREELQKAFTEAVIATRDLLKEAQADVLDTTCMDTADAKKAADLVPLLAERERASSLIESSAQSIAALEPILDLVDSRAEKMSAHIYDVLTPECAEAKEVSGLLEKIRELILLLEECPGRNDFKLKIPEEKKEEADEQAVA